MEEIYCDNDFNCRGKINPLDVVDLANDIKAKGLDFPITIQPYDKHPPEKWRIVAGHRRFTAYRVNGATSIPCTIRRDLDDFQAAALNLRENILRKELNILQEARGIRKFMIAGWGEPALARELQQSRGWVQIRFMLLLLPEDIQNEAAAGWITQEQIRKISQQKGDEAKYALLRKLKEAKVRGEKIELPNKMPKNPRKETRHPQKREVMFNFMDTLLTTLGAGFTTRLLAWTAGEISDYDIHVELKKECDAKGIPFELPDWVKVIV